MSKKIKSLAMLGTSVIALGTFSPIFGTVAYANTAPESSQTIDNSKAEIVETLANNGYLEVDEESQTIVITEKYKQELLANTDADRYNVVFTENSVSITPKYSFRSFTGVNKIVYTWKGFDVYLDSENANKLAAGVGIAGTAAALIPDPTVSKVLAVVLGLASGLISYNNSAGRGVIIVYIGNSIGGATPHWVTSQ